MPGIAVSIRVSLLLVILATLGPPAGAWAGPQSGDQRKCVVTLGKNVAKVAKLQGKENWTCIKLGAKGKLEGSMEACLAADAKGRIRKAQDRAQSALRKHCTVERPDFGISTASLDSASAIANQAAVLGPVDLIHDVFGSDLDSAIRSDALDHDTAVCQRAIAKSVKKCQDAHLREFGSCVRRGLKAGTVQDDSSMATCMGSDAKGKLAKACSPTGGKMARDLGRKCGASNLEEAFPGCGQPQAEDVAVCLDARVRCRVCSGLNAVNQLDRDCDLFDDGISNLSCQTGDLLALSYNVAGLPEGLSGSHPAVNTPLIAPLLNGYELVLMQESWKTPDPNPLAPLRTYHEILEAGSNHPFMSLPAPPPLNGNPERPEAILADGLNRFSRFPFEPVTRERWVECDNSSADCLSLKGFSFARTTFAPGVEVHVYDLHMEAGGTANDERIRADDLNQLAAFMEANSADQPILVGGDFNLDTDEEPDKSQYNAFLARTGLTDVCRYLACLQPGRIDKWAFRSSAELRIQPVSWHFELDVFKRFDGEPLSDHDALAVQFLWEHR